MSDRLRLLALGAHPDDCEVKAGGLAALYAGLGHRVRFVALTNGATGHHESGGIELARRRRAEALAAAAVAGIEYEILDNHTGELEPTVANRKDVIRLLREFRPDLVLTHRPWDYHPDHRCAGQLVQDAAYIVTVPNMLPLTDHLERLPVIMYLGDTFQKPLPLDPDVVVDIDAVMDRKLDMLHCHASQMYEWLPYNRGQLDQVPAGDAERRAWMGEQRRRYFAATAERYRSRLVELYGEARGRQVRCAEAFETCEYGAPLTAELRRRLFPFLPAPCGGGARRGVRPMEPCPTTRTARQSGSA
ncbi:MAG: PIG-L deacetylase family protein [Gemmatimonadota bacterium]